MKCWICGKKVQSLRVHLIKEERGTFSGAVIIEK